MPYNFCFPCKKSYVLFVNVFKINVLKVIYRRGSVSKVNVSKGNELKGKVPIKSVSSKLDFFMKNNRKHVNIKHPEFPFWIPRRNLAYPYFSLFEKLFVFVSFTVAAHLRAALC